MRIVVEQRYSCTPWPERRLRLYLWRGRCGITLWTWGA